MDETLFRQDAIKQKLIFRRVRVNPCVLYAGRSRDGARAQIGCLKSKIPRPI